MCSGYIDIHSHILPGVDDGSKDCNMSMEMLRIAEKSGINEIILTPHNKPMHHNVKLEKMRILSEQLQEAMAQEGINIRLHTGNEIYYRSDILDVLEHEDAYTLAESSYVLTEFGPMEAFDRIRGGIYQILSGGYKPILAHVERYASICSRPEYADELAEMGCYIQVNAGSILGWHGWQEKRFTKKLLKRKMVHFVATDAHNMEKRGPHLKECAELIMKKYGEAYARQLMIENPAHVIADEYI